VTPDEIQILVLRELRKVGLAVGPPRVHRRSELPEPGRGLVLELVISLSGAGATRRALIVCRSQVGVVARDVVEDARARLPEASADVAIIFATAEFAPDALAAACESGVALLQIADGRRVFDASGWGEGTGGIPGHYPAWLPAHIAQLVDRDAAGGRRVRMLEAGRPEMLLDCLRVASNP
jgi:hypothetical protein